MSYQLSPILAGSTVVAGTNVNVSLGYAAIVVYNTSYVGFTIRDPRGNAVFVAPNTADRILLGATDDYISLFPQYTISSNIPPVDKVIMVAYLPTELGQDNRAFPFNLGNLVASITTLANDGNITGTTFVEATQSGNGTGSNVILDNSGDLKLAEWQSGTLTTIFQTLAGVAAGATNVFLGKAGNFFTQVQGNLRVVGNSIFSSAITSIVGQTTAGSYGVPITVAVVTNQAILNTTNTTIVNINAPNDGASHTYLICVTFQVGGGNTNNGVVTLKAVPFDPWQGGPQNQYFSGYVSTVAMNAQAIVKGATNRVIAQYLEVNANSQLLVQYQNTAAGTISDLISCVVVMLS